MTDDALRRMVEEKMRAAWNRLPVPIYNNARLEASVSVAVALMREAQADHVACSGYGLAETMRERAEAAEKESRAYRAIAKSVSGALCDSRTIPVPALEDVVGNEKALRQLLAERDEARKALAECEQRWKEDACL